MLASLLPRRVSALKSCLFFCLLLTSCSSSEPQTLYYPVTVPTARPVPCFQNLPPEPLWPLEQIDATASLEQTIQSMIAELLLRRGYDYEIRAILESCQSKDN